MQKHKEIEFKTFISKEQYESLLKEFNLTDKTFTQTNTYFDTLDLSLLNNKIMVRIRKKEQYKLTKKEKNNFENMETSIYLEDDKACEMIQNGFDGNIIGINNMLYKICSLTTVRAKTNYKDGMIFFDKSTYSDITDYEIEYEANDYIEGEKTFKEFLKEHNIKQTEVISKSKRAINKYLEKQKN